MTFRVAIITPSYERDFARCALLCESMDQMATEPMDHLILVADHDKLLFQSLAGPRRHILSDSVLLPDWLRATRIPMATKNPWRWISRRLDKAVWPMSGWHIQQMRKLMVANHTDADVLVMADSDSLFIKPFDSSCFVRADGAVRLYAVPHEIRADDARYSKHLDWCRVAHALLGLPPPAFPATDYIINLVTWRRDHALALADHVQRSQGRDLLSALGRHRTFSEYQLYGVFAEIVRNLDGHFASSERLSHTYWSGDALTEESLTAFCNAMGPDQIALCVQSFTETPPDVLRRFLQRRLMVTSDM